MKLKRIVIAGILVAIILFSSIYVYNILLVLIQQMERNWYIHAISHGA